jgi:hypothetical protein
MANVILNDDNEVTLYESKVIAQVETNAFLMPLIGGVNDMSSCITRPSKASKIGKQWNVPLRKAVTDEALEDGATYEGQAKQSIMSTSTIVANERGMVFGGVKEFEDMKTIVDLRETHYQEAGQWSTADFDKKGFSKMVLATSSLPARTARATSQYNVEYVNEGASWAGLDNSNYITARSISRAKAYFVAKRNIRPCHIGGGKYGHILILPSEATYRLGQEDNDFQEKLQYALPRSEDHIFFKGHGLNPWGYYDGVFIVEDQRPVYGGTNGTFLTTEEEDAYIRFQGIFLGAQAMGFAEWKDLTWFERIYDHGRNFEVSTSRTFGFVKNVINIGTLDSVVARDYGLAYLCGTAPRLD